MELKFNFPPFNSVLPTLRSLWLALVSVTCARNNLYTDTIVSVTRDPKMIRAELRWDTRLGREWSYDIILEQVKS
jgi:hypothetical protein